MFGSTSQFSFGGSAPSNRMYFTFLYFIYLFLSLTAFGATSTTTAAAPTSTGFLFGSSTAPAAGTAAPSSLNSTFTFGNPTASASTAPATSQPLTFGTGLQSSTTIRPFGSATTFGAAPASTTPATGATSKKTIEIINAFYIWIIIIGFGGTSLFGATQPTAQPTSIFGSTQSTFGATQPAQTTNIFGATLTGTTQIGTTFKYDAVPGQGKINKIFFFKLIKIVFFFFYLDTMRTKNNTFQTINTKLQCICAMKEYINKSLEELRMEDYQSNRKFGTAPSMFGATNFQTTTPFSPAPYGASSILNLFLFEYITNIHFLF